jgi:hypothetical protein
MSIYDEIATERARQIAKGFDAAHDDDHAGGELGQAAACYAAPITLLHEDRSGVSRGVHGTIPLGWPFRPEEYRPGGDYREDLVKAAAFIVAEIERIDRLIDPPVDDGR